MSDSGFDYSKVDFDEILDYFNITNRTQSGADIQFSCPFPEHYRGDRNPSAGINVENGKWHCFSCGRKGSLTSFVAELEGISSSTAARWIREGFASTFVGASLKSYLQEIIDKEDLPPKIDEPKIPEAAITLFQIDWDKAEEAYKTDNLPRRLRYIFDRGLSVDSLKTYNIGYDKHSKRITIPLRNVDGVLVGFKGRATSPLDEPKYLGVGDKSNIHYGFPTCKTRKYVFGISTVPSGADVIIVEGEFDAIWLRQLGFENTVSIGGSSPSEEQINQIVTVAGSAVLLLDPDRAGEKAERKLAKSLLQFIPVRIAKVPEGLDPQEMSQTQIHKAIENSTNALTQTLNRNKE